MGNLRAVLSVSLLSFAACGDDGGSAKPDAPVIRLDAAVDAAPDTPPLPDAPSYDLTCLGNAAPTTANTTVTISGTAQEVVLNGITPSIQPNAGVTVKACKGDCTGANNLGTTTSDAQGAFATMALTTGGAPLDGYIDATKTNDRRTLVYPPMPLTMDQAGVPVLMFNNAVITALNAALLDPPQNDTTNGILGIIVTDCANTPITEGVVVSAKQGGNAVGDTPLDLGSLAGAQAAGTWLITNVPAGDTVVSAKYNNMDLLAHTVVMHVGTTVTTGVRPGY